jgi:hypothetical protein
VSNPIVLQHVYCSQNNRPHGTIKHIHSSHLSFCSRLAIYDHSRKLQPQSQLCDYCGRMFQSQLATLVASRPSQINTYIRPFWSDFLIPSCIFYLHANYTMVINPISNRTHTYDVIYLIGIFPFVLLVILGSALIRATFTFTHISFEAVVFINALFDHER